MIFVIVIPLFSVGVGLLVDWTWFSHIGFREIFDTILGTQFGLGIGCGAVFLLLTGLNLWAARGVAHRSGYLATARPSARIAEFPAIEKFPAVLSEPDLVRSLAGGLPRWPMVGDSLGLLPSGDARGTHDGDRPDLRHQPELLSLPAAVSFLSCIIWR